MCSAQPTIATSLAAETLTRLFYMMFYNSDFSTKPCGTSANAMYPSGSILGSYQSLLRVRWRNNPHRFTLQPTPSSFELPYRHIFHFRFTSHVDRRLYNSLLYQRRKRNGLLSRSRICRDALPYMEVSTCALGKNFHKRLPSLFFPDQPGVLLILGRVRPQLFAFSFRWKNHYQ